VTLLRSFRALPGRLLIGVLDLLPQDKLEAVIVGLANRRSSSLAPDQGLRFLFRLDAALYPLAGRLCERYGKGVHAKHRLTRYHDFFIDLLAGDERVLEVGCGAGHLAHDITMRTGCSLTAMDMDAGKIGIAKSLYPGSPVEWITGDATRDELNSGFDVVILSNVLEHLSERDAFLRRVWAATGATRFLIRVPLFERDWRVPLKKELGIEWRLDPTHETEYTLESFAREMSDAGLEVLHQVVRWGEIWAEAKTKRMSEHSTVTPSPRAGGNVTC